MRYRPGSSLDMAVLESRGVLIVSVGTFSLLYQFCDVLHISLQTLLSCVVLLLYLAELRLKSKYFIFLKNARKK